jgi:acyl-CoA dehydrogenase
MARGCSINSDLKSRSEATAATAAENSGLVDRDARFPREAFLAARTQRLLGIMVPADLGGEGPASLKSSTFATFWHERAPQPA